MSYDTKLGICPVCEAGTIASPHHVCRSCYEQMKSYHVHSRALIEEQQPQLQAPPEIVEKNIAFEMSWEADEWAKLTKNGLSAVAVLIEIVDDMEPDIPFHRRRIAFMRDLIDRLNPKIFLPAGKEQMDRFMQSAIDFWNGNISEDKRQRIYTDFTAFMPDKKPSDWTAKSIVYWMMELEDRFDWMWEQWMESVHDAVGDELPDEVWIMLFKKHFAQEIAAWPRKDHTANG
ncbi:hypothetical protein ACYULU_04680 [Breznakiellaceae bacterium SP9]